MNNSCSGYSTSVAIILGVSNGSSVFVCLFAAILVGIFKLYQQTVYRLALYQVLAALMLGTVLVVEVIFVNYQNAPETYHRACVAVAFLLLYSMWVKVVSTVWVTVHVFCYAVRYKNLKKLEGIYVATSLLIPVLIAIVPLTTHTYGLAGSWCWIQNWKNNCPTETLTLGIIEQLYGLAHQCLYFWEKFFLWLPW